MPTLPPIAGTMRKTGMSTADIIKALCAAKGMNLNLRSVMVVDVKAAQLKGTLDSLGQSIEKQIQKPAQVAQDGIDLISNNRSTSALGSALNTKLAEINQKIRAVADEQAARKKQCVEVMAAFQKPSGSTTPADTQSTKEKLEALEKVTEKLKRQMEQVRRELEGLSNETERTLIASNLTKAKPAATAGVSPAAPRNDEDSGPS